LKFFNSSLPQSCLSRRTVLLTLAVLLCKLSVDFSAVLRCLSCRLTIFPVLEYEISFLSRTESNGGDCNVLVMFVENKSLIAETLTMQYSWLVRSDMTVYDFLLLAFLSSLASFFCIMMPLLKKIEKARTCRYFVTRCRQPGVCCLLL